MADADESSIPAYQQMRGEVVEVNGDSVRVAWDCDGGQSEFGFRDADTLKKVG
jgi:hypothetical protein